MTATPRSLLRALTTRDGHVCAWHGVSCGTESLVPHHRANRGMGGRKSANRLSNLVWLCSEMNGLIESDPLLADLARRKGLKISSHDNPEHVPIRHFMYGLCLLQDDGTIVTGIVVF